MYTPGGADIHILRLGYQDRAGLMPLLYPLEAGWVLPESPWKLAIRHDSPAALASAVLDGRLDAAFMPTSAVWAQGETLAALGGWALSTEGISQLAHLLAPRRLDLMDGEDAALTSEAAGTSAEYLLRALLKPYYDIQLNLSREGETKYNAKGTRLLYGDRAVIEGRKQTGEAVSEDLGVAWFVLSGLPMVWEMLATRRDLESRKPGAPALLQELLKRSQRSGQEQRATIMDQIAGRLGVDSAGAKDFAARQVYTLGDKEQKGLARFLDEASRAGVLPR